MDSLLLPVDIGAGSPMVSSMSLVRTVPARLLAMFAGLMLLLAVLQPALLAPEQADTGASRLESVKGLGVSIIAVRPQSPCVTPAPHLTKAWDPILALSETSSLTSDGREQRCLVPTGNLNSPDRCPGWVGVVELRI